jgi:hypothetical protein
MKKKYPQAQVQVQVQESFKLNQLMINMLLVMLLMLAVIFCNLPAP